MDSLELGKSIQSISGCYTCVTGVCEFYIILLSLFLSLTKFHAFLAHFTHLLLKAEKSPYFYTILIEIAPLQTVKE